MAKNSGERILVADDDATSRKLLTRILTRAGFDCAEAPDGIEALKLLRADPPSLLLLDYDMPGMNGAEVLKQLRRDGNAAVAQIPAIMLTGHGGEESEVLCLEAGADDLVAKPVLEWESGGTSFVKFKVTAPFLAKPYFSTDGYVFKGGKIAAEMSTFDATKLEFKKTK